MRIANHGVPFASSDLRGRLVAMRHSRPHAAASAQSEVRKGRHLHAGCRFRTYPRVSSAARKRRLEQKQSAGDDLLFFLGGQRRWHGSCTVNRTGRPIRRERYMSKHMSAFGTYSGRPTADCNVRDVVADHSGAQLIAVYDWQAGHGAVLRAHQLRIDLWRRRLADCRAALGY